jgi:hypothetical protein
MVEKVFAEVATEQGISRADPAQQDRLEVDLMKPVLPCDSLKLDRPLFAFRIGTKTPSKPEEVKYIVTAYYRFSGKKYFAKFGPLPLTTEELLDGGSDNIPF